MPYNYSCEFNFEILKIRQKRKDACRFMKNYFGRTMSEIEKQTGIKNLSELRDFLHTKKINFKEVGGYDYNESKPIIINFHVDTSHISDGLLEQLNPCRIGTKKYTRIEVIIYAKMITNMSESEVARSIVKNLFFGNN